MPWKSLKEAKDAGAHVILDDVALTLEQINAIAAQADAIDDASGKNFGWPTAIKQFKDTHKIEDGKWVAKILKGKHSISFDAAKTNTTALKGILTLLGRDDLEPVERNGKIFVVEKYAASELATEDFPNVRIFEAGTWTGMSGKSSTYTEDDLKQIANDFNALEKKNAIEAPVKLGHDDDQPLLKADGLPAAGWLSNFRAVGKYLYADLKKVPKKIAQLINAGGYRRVSAEIRRNFKDAAGKVYPLMIDGLALLGEKHPAIGNLGDIIDSRYAASDKECDTFKFSFEMDGDKGDSFSANDNDGGDTHKLKEGENYMAEDKLEDFKAKYEELKAKYEDLCGKMEGMKTKLAKYEEEEKKVVDKDNDDMKAKLSASEEKAEKLELDLKVATAELEKFRATAAESEKQVFVSKIEKKFPPALIPDLCELRESKKAKGADVLDKWEKEMFSRPDNAFLTESPASTDPAKAAESDYEAKVAEAEKYAKDNGLNMKDAHDFSIAMLKVGYKGTADVRYDDLEEV